MKNKILTILAFALFTIPVKTQNVEQLIKSISDSLLIARTGSTSENCIRDDDTGAILSCFTFKGKPEWITDFDGDGENDLVIKSFEEEMGNGGNDYRNDYMVIILKKGKIAEIHPIFGEAKYSHGLLEINKVENGKIYATYEENPASRNSIDNHYSPLRRVFPVFEYYDGQMMEQSYFNCPIADMDKYIFRKDLLYTVKRNTHLNELYEEEQEEILYFDSTKEDYILASFHGCKNIYIQFSYDIPYAQSIEKNSVERKEALLNLLRFLQYNTRYNSTLSLLIKKIEITDDFEKTDDSIVDMIYRLPNNWEAQLLINKISTQEGEDIRFTLNLDRYLEREKIGFWDEIKR